MKHGYLKKPAKSFSFPSTPTLVSYPPSFIGSFYPPFPLFISLPSCTKPDHRHAVHVMVAIATEALQQQVCGVTVRSGEKVTVGHRCSTNIFLFDGSTLLFTLPMQTTLRLNKKKKKIHKTHLIKWSTLQPNSICWFLLGWVMFSAIYNWITCLDYRQPRTRRWWHYWCETSFLFVFFSPHTL